MQYKSKDYDPKIHQIFRCLTVKQPFADKISTGEKRIEIRKKNTNYRGQLVISSSKKPFIDGRSGVAICITELYDVVKVEDLTEKEKSSTCLTSEEIDKYGGYAWMLTHPVPLNPVPIKGNLGIWKLITDDGYMSAYTSPKDIILSEGKTLPILIMYGVAVAMACVIIVGVNLWLIKYNQEIIDKIMSWLTLT